MQVRSILKFGRTMIVKKGLRFVKNFAKLTYNLILQTKSPPYITVTFCLQVLPQTQVDLGIKSSRYRTIYKTVKICEISLHLAQNNRQTNLVHIYIKPHPNTIFQKTTISNEGSLNLSKIELSKCA